MRRANRRRLLPHVAWCRGVPDGYEVTVYDELQCAAEGHDWRQTTNSHDRVDCIRCGVCRRYVPRSDGLGVGEWEWDWQPLS